MTLAEIIPMAKRPTQGQRATVTTPLIPASYSVGEAWYVATCRRQQERIAVQWATERGYEAFTPLTVTARIVRAKRVITARPLFVGYCFLRLDIQKDPWGELIEDEGRPSGIMELLPRIGIPLPVKDGLVDLLRRSEQAGLFDFSTPQSNFKTGEVVEIKKEGPFYGLIARVRSASAKKRVRILLDSLGEIDIDACFLERAS